MAILFDDFISWKEYYNNEKVSLFQPVLDYEKEQKGRNEEEIWEGLRKAYRVMKDAVKTGLEEDMTSGSGMINNGAKKVYKNHRFKC